jgi:hypothetical protein
MHVSTRLLVAGLIAFVAFGCSKKTEEYAAEKAIESATGGEATVTDGGESVRLKTEQGEIAVSGSGELQLPKDLPKDVVVLDGAKINTSFSTPEGLMVAYTIDAGAAEAYSKIRAAMKDGGWTEESSMESPEASVLQLRKENRVVQYTVGLEDGATTVTLAHSIDMTGKAATQ